MKLRTFALILTLALGLLAAPVPAEGQRAGKVHVVGMLTSRSYTGFGDLFGRESRLPWLAEFGYVEGQNLRVEYRFAVDDKRLPDLAGELVKLRVDVMVVAGTPAIRAAQQATRTIPIVMLAHSDPVKAGLIDSLARPGGNVTGLTILTPELAGKRLELLKETVPGLTRVGVLWNPASADVAEEWKATQLAARALEVELQPLEVGSHNDLEPAFEAAARARVGALLVLADAVLGRFLIPDLAARHGLPAMYSRRRSVGPSYGGLMFYGPSWVDAGRRVSIYVDKLLKGTKPADLPVEQPTHFELVINMKTAKTLGLTIPPSLLFRADRVIR